MVGDELSVKAVVAASLKRPRVEDPYGPATWLRSSSLPYMCAREEVLRARHNTARKETLHAKELLTFAVGSALHWAVQNEALSPVIAWAVRQETLGHLGNVWGVWRCPYCAARHGGLPATWTSGLPHESTFPLPIGMSTVVERFQVDPADIGGFVPLGDGEVRERYVSRPQVCAGCGRPGHRLLYTEQWFGNLSAKVGGSPDGFLLTDRLPGFGLLEIKSISGRQSWQVKQVPRLDHVVQAHVYLWLTGARWVIILYWDKGRYGTDAWIEHFVERDEGVIDQIKGQVRSLRVGLLEDTLPDRICQHADCVRAAECSTPGPCFEEDM